MWYIKSREDAVAVGVWTTKVVVSTVDVVELVLLSCEDVKPEPSLKIAKCDDGLFSAYKFFERTYYYYNIGKAKLISAFA